MEIGPTKVEFLGVAKSTWNLHRFNVLDPGSTFKRKFGVPGGGAAAPSRSEGKRLANELERLKHTNAGAATPFTMPTRSHAHVSAPTKALPFAKMFHVT
jgi:hypothetical protein